MLDNLFKATDIVSTGTRIPSNVFLAPKLFLLYCAGILGMLVWQKLIGWFRMGVRVRKCREEGVKTKAKDQPQHLQIHPNHNSLRWSTLLFEKKKEMDTENKQFLHVKLADPIIISYAFLFSWILHSKDILRLLRENTITDFH